MLPVLLAVLGLCATARAYDVTEKLSFGGVLAGAVQCQELARDFEAENQCQGAVPFQPDLSFRPNAENEIFFKLGFAAGNGLNTVTPFVIPPWAADVEDDVRNINGRGRNYLLNAWYQHSAEFRGGSALRATVGIIDATDYLDENIYANDEYTQFMNSALVNGPNVFLPSYDPGAALEWEKGRWSMRGVYMNVGDGDRSDTFAFRSASFFGAQLGYHVRTALGIGNYRILFAGTSESFPDPSGTSKERRRELLFSFDQQLGEVVGAFIRFGGQKQKAAVDYEAIYSGGINILGSRWGRAQDNIGLAYGYLKGGNLDVIRTQVAEAYYRFVVNEFLSMTGDVQYMKDDLKSEQGPEGWILGLRLTAEF